MQPGMLFSVFEWEGLEPGERGPMAARAEEPGGSPKQNG